MLLNLFITFLKIGTFTFGGGYAMIPIVKDYCIEKEKWITEEEFLNMLTVSESTPGPVAINMATYIGYKKAGLLGAIFATVGVVFSSYWIIYFISLFFEDILKISLISNAFKGIRIAVSIIILNSVINLFKTEYKNTNNKLFIFCVSFVTFFVMILSSLFDLKIQTIYIIIISFIFSFIVMRIKKI